MYQLTKSLCGMILLGGALFLLFCPLASAQLQLGFSPCSSPSNSHLNPDSIPFGPAVNYGVGASPHSVFCADLDGDLDLDLAVANGHSSNVSILKNNGDGTFQPKVDYAAGDYPHSVFCADLDGDLDLDLAVANGHSSNVSILKNNGDGTFQPKVDYAAGDYPWSVFCADLDGDLELDLAVANKYSNNVSILKNNSRHLVCGDVDCDNKAAITDVVYLVNFIFKSGPKPGECAR